MRFQDSPTADELLFFIVKELKDFPITDTPLFIDARYTPQNDGQFLQIKAHFGAYKDFEKFYPVEKATHFGLTVKMKMQDSTQRLVEAKLKIAMKAKEGVGMTDFYKMRKEAKTIGEMLLWQWFENPACSGSLISNVELLENSIQVSSCL